MQTERNEQRLSHAIAMRKTTAGNVHCIYSDPR